MALTKVTTNAITDDAITTAKIAPNTVIASDILDGTITVAKLTSTLDLSSNTVTLPSTSVTNDMLSGSIANAKLANPSFNLNGVTINLGDTTEISAGTDWQTGVVADGSTVTSAAAGEGYFIDTTSFAHTINLPGSPALGDEITIVDASGTADTNNITVGRNGNNIQGTAADLTVSSERAAFTLVYYNATQGWLLKTN